MSIHGQQRGKIDSELDHGQQRGKIFTGQPYPRLSRTTSRTTLHVRALDFQLDRGQQRGEICPGQPYPCRFAAVLGVDIGLDEVRLVHCLCPAPRFHGCLVIVVATRHSDHREVPEVQRARHAWPLWVRLRQTCIWDHLTLFEASRHCSRTTSGERQGRLK